MLVPFKSLSNDSRIWIYQSNRKFSQKEIEFIQKETVGFLEVWTAHGDSLQAGFEILYDQFLIIGLNEKVNEASGCSIDKSVNYIRELENKLSLSLLERSKVAIEQNAQIHLVNFFDLKKLVEKGEISKDAKVFNNSIASKGELESTWLQPAEKSWVKRYF